LTWQSLLEQQWLGISNDLFTVTLWPKDFLGVFVLCEKFDLLRHHLSTSFTVLLVPALLNFKMVDFLNI